MNSKGRCIKMEDKGAKLVKEIAAKVDVEMSL